MDHNAASFDWNENLNNSGIKKIHILCGFGNLLIFLVLPTWQDNFNNTISWFLCRAYSKLWGHDCVFWGTFFEKSAFCLFAPPKQMPFWTTSYENIFSETQETRFGVIVTLNKGLDEALLCIRQHKESYIASPNFKHFLQKSNLNLATQGLAVFCFSFEIIPACLTKG